MFLWKCWYHSDVSTLWQCTRIKLRDIMVCRQTIFKGISSRVYLEKEKVHEWGIENWELAVSPARLLHMLQSCNNSSALRLLRRKLQLLLQNWWFEWWLWKQQQQQMKIQQEQQGPKPTTNKRPPPNTYIYLQILEMSYKYQHLSTYNAGDDKTTT